MVSSLELQKRGTGGLRRRFSHARIEGWNRRSTVVDPNGLPILYYSVGATRVASYGITRLVFFLSRRPQEVSHDVPR